MTELYVIEGDATCWEDALRLTADVLYAQGCVDEGFYESCAERERSYPTGFSNACPVAIPHTTAEHVRREAVCVLRLARPVGFWCMEDSSEVVSVRYVFNLALLNGTAHLELIRSLILCARDPGFFVRFDQLGPSELRAFLMKSLFERKGELTCG